MKSHSETPDLIAALQLKLAGLEESSVHRDYHPESQQRFEEQRMEAVGRLAGGVAHDFNNILMVIMWYASMLKTDTELVPQQMEKVEQILLASEKGAHLTSSLLAFSRKQFTQTSSANLNDNIILHAQQFLMRTTGEDVPDAAALEGGTETLMVAEDESALRTLVESVLTSYGYRVILARDGQEAVEKFEAEGGNVALILMDMIMPRMNGKEACDAIRTLDPKAKVIFTSGYTMDILQSRDLLHEATELIMKPVHPVDLLKKVREMLDK